MSPRASSATRAWWVNRIAWLRWPNSASSVKRLGGARVVEARQQVVADERQRLAGAALQQGEAKREKKLVARALAEALDLDVGAGGSAGDQDRPVAVVVADGESGETAGGGEREHLAGAGDQRVLRGGAMFLDGAVGEFGGGGAGEPSLGDVEQFACGLDALARGVGGVAPTGERLAPGLRRARLRRRDADLVQQHRPLLLGLIDLSGQGRSVELGLFRAQLRFVERIAGRGEVATQRVALGLQRAAAVEPVEREAKRVVIRNAERIAQARQTLPQRGALGLQGLTRGGALGGARERRASSSAARRARPSAAASLGNASRPREPASDGAAAATTAATACSKSATSARMVSMRCVSSMYFSRGTARSSQAASAARASSGEASARNRRSCMAAGHSAATAAAAASARASAASSSAMIFSACSAASLRSRTREPIRFQGVQPGARGAISLGE